MTAKKQLIPDASRLPLSAAENACKRDPAERPAVLKLWHEAQHDHLEGSGKQGMLAPPPEFPIQQVCGEA